MKRIKWNRALDFALVRLCSLLPIQRNKVVLQSVPDYSDNCRAFSDYLRENHPELDQVWLVKDPSGYSGGKGLRFVRSDSRFLIPLRDYHLARARFVIYTHSAPVRRWRKGQTFIHTCHSASQLKAGDARSANQVRLVEPDYVLRCGEEGVRKAMATRGLPREKIQVLGMPRLDLLYRHVPCVEKLFPGEKPRMTVIAMETFKQHRNWTDSTAAKSYGLNIIESPEGLSALDAWLGEKGVLLIIKPHPLQDLSYLEMNALKHVRFLRDEDLDRAGVQLYELLENCDAVLTDYSSVFYDFLLLDRPVGFMIHDMEAYTRGFIDDDPLEQMTGPKIRTLPELQAFLEDCLAGRDGYAEKRKAVRDRVFLHQDDRNCERLYEFLRQL